MTPPNLISVLDALERVLEGAARTGTELIALRQAIGRTLAEPLVAKRTQPPFRSSAMDGYAIRGEDGTEGARLKLIGEAAAGHLFEGPVGPGEAVRIFTGGAVPDGADTVLIQENTRREGDVVHVTIAAEHGRHIRSAGLDFNEDDVLLPEGTLLNSRMVGLAASAGYGMVCVARKPRVAILATGDELVLPGTRPGPGQIVASNTVMIAGIAESVGAEVIDLGIAPDRLPDIQTQIRHARDHAHVLVTIGGASVGDYDLTHKALENEGVEMNFWRIAMRPGRPLMYGRFGGGARAVGLPGNPGSAFIGAALFLMPLLRALQGRKDVMNKIEPAILGKDLRGNDWRADHLRATLTWNGTGLPVAKPYGRQDSSMLCSLAEADCLIVRPADDPPRAAGEPCRIIKI